MNQLIAPIERQCKGCGICFITTDARKWFHTKGCGRSKREPQTNEWLLANKPHLPTEPCLNCGKLVVQYRKRRHDGELRDCSHRCAAQRLELHKAIVENSRRQMLPATWPPLDTTGPRSRLPRGCIDCGTGLRLGRCFDHHNQAFSLKRQVLTKLKWLLPRACRKCGLEFNRFSQGGVCDVCHTKTRSAIKAGRRAKVRGGLRRDKGICHQELHRIFNATCQICGNKTQPPEVWIGWDGKTAMPYAPTVDHIIPLAKAGTHTWDNVQLAHSICNSFKNAS